MCSAERKFAMINISKTETTHAGKRLLKGQPPNHDLTKLRLLTENMFTFSQIHM
jgi:hypothetical protein